MYWKGFVIFSIHDFCFLLAFFLLSVFHIYFFCYFQELMDVVILVFLSIPNIFICCWLAEGVLLLLQLFVDMIEDL